MTTDRLLHLPSVAASCVKLCFIICVSGPHELGVLLQMAVLLREVIATVAFLTVSEAFHKGGV